MSRELIIALGAIAWAVFAFDAIVHVIDGDWIISAIAVAVGAVWIAWLRMRQHAPERG
ncbi:MAG: hypothetical protein ABI562_00890 [Chloroflexota bacterium]